MKARRASAARQAVRGDQSPELPASSSSNGCSGLLLVEAAAEFFAGEGEVHLPQHPVFGAPYRLDHIDAAETHAFDQHDHLRPAALLGLEVIEFVDRDRVGFSPASRARSRTRPEAAMDDDDAVEAVGVLVVCGA